MKAVVIGVKENKAAVLMHDGSMRYVENRGYEKGTLLELPDTDDAVISFEKAKSKHNLRFPRRFLYSAAASFAVLMLSGAMVSFACPASTIPISSDPEVTLGVNIYGRVIEINAGNEENEELLKEIKRDMKGRPVPEVSQAIELKFDKHRMESEDDQGAQAPAPENPGSRVLDNPAPENPDSRDMDNPGSQDTDTPAPESSGDQSPKRPENTGDQSPKRPESTGDQRPEKSESPGDQRPENPESTGDQRPENPGIPAVDNPAPENQGSPVMDNPGSQGTEPPAPKIQQDQPNQDGQDIEPPAPEIRQEQPGQDLEPPTHPEDNENPPETESGGHSEKPDDDTKDGPKEDHGPGPGDHGDGGRDGPGGGP